MLLLPLPLSLLTVPLLLFFQYDIVGLGVVRDLLDYRWRGARVGHFRVAVLRRGGLGVCLLRGRGGALLVIGWVENVARGLLCEGRVRRDGM
jgi:hypothetical protein